MLFTVSQLELGLHIKCDSRKSDSSAEETMSQFFTAANPPNIGQFNHVIYAKYLCVYIYILLNTDIII